MTTPPLSASEHHASPLRLWHTADWHLGQSFHNFDREYEHAQFLEWMLQQLKERRPDVLLLSGDVFDSINPPASAQRRFYSFLQTARAALPGLQMVITAGNHDAAARLEAPADLLESLQISVVGTVSRNAEGRILLSKFIVPVKNALGQVKALVLALPYLRPADVPLLPEANNPYLDGIRDLYHQVTAEATRLRDRLYPEAALIALGHCHMQEGAESRDSERRIIIGGAEALGKDAFPQELAYVALGHLHKPQELDSGRIRYSGSPIPLSFSEKDYAHHVLEVAIENGCLSSVTPLPIPKTVPLLRVPATRAVPLEELLLRLDDLTADPALPPERHPFLEVRVLDDGPDPTRRQRIEDKLKGKSVRLATLRMEPLARAETTLQTLETPSLESLENLDPLEMMLSAHLEHYGAEAEADLKAVMQQILNELPQ